MINTLSTGDCIHKYNKSIVIDFKGKRKVLSTSVFNGGYREDLKAVFNHDLSPGPGMTCELKAPTYEGHLSIVAEELGYKPEEATGIGTVASMNNVSIKTESYKELTVSAIVTGGIEVNGGRVGEKAPLWENNGDFKKITHGTINIILVIDGDLPPGTLTRSLITCTEAKTAVLQELMAGSNYSSGLATGSGTDGTIILCNEESPLKLTDAGKHTKLGELTGTAVKNAVKEALFLQTGLCPESQHSMLKRFRRYGVNEEKIWKEYCNLAKEVKFSKAEFIHNIHSMDNREDLVTLSSLYIHLLDQLNWKLLSEREVIEYGNMITEKFAENLHMEYKGITSHPEGINETIEVMLNNITVIMAKKCGNIC
jgi:adenosylcobinamide amidohydrolase